MSALLSNTKLINETNKMLKKMTTSSLKSINQQHIEYILFHRNGVCSAISSKTLTNGEILIISRFLSLIFKNNLLSLSNLVNRDFAKLLISLLNGLMFQKDNYYWITALSILSQNSMIEFFSQSRQMLKIFKNIFLDKDPKILNLVKNTILTISNLLIKLLEYLIANSEFINLSLLFYVTRISCFLIIHLLQETGIAGKEIQTIAKYLFEIRNLIKLKPNEFNNYCFLKQEATLLLKKLNEESILSCRNEAAIFIKNLLPYLACYFDKLEIMEKLCTCCCSILQRTTSSVDCTRMMTLAGEIIYFGSKLYPKILHDDLIVKSVMGFIKVLPVNVQHSDARNVLWWHILCSMTPIIFQSRFKTYFIPFLENILGQYFNKNKSNYGISEFNLTNGYMHLSQLTNHVIINVIENINQNQCFHMVNINSSSILVPEYMHLAKLKKDIFSGDILYSPENIGFLLKAVEIWISILKRNQSVHKIKYKKLKRSDERYLQAKQNSLDEDLCRIQNELISKFSNIQQHSKNDNSAVHHKRKKVPKHVISLSSDDTEISIIPDKFEKEISKTCKKLKTKGIPERKNVVETGGCKEKSTDTNRTNFVPVPKSNSNFKDMKNLLHFFKCDSMRSDRTTNNESNTSKVNTIPVTNLPLKKRKLNFESTSILNQNSSKSYLDETSTGSVLSNNLVFPPPKKRRINEVSPTDSFNSSLILANNTHKYFLRSDLHNNNSLILSNPPLKPSNRKISKAKAPKSNVDFTVNVIESSKCPNSKDNKVTSSKIMSKKVELRIKFDLNPISEALELGNTNNTNNTNNGDCRKGNNIFKKNWKLVEIKDK